MRNVEVTYLNSKNGVPTVEINSYLLHSKYNPIKEAERIVQKDYIENYVHILFGYGLGYIADELKNKMKNKDELLIIEPYKNQLGIENNEILDMMNRNTVRMKIENMLDNDRRDIKVICSPNYDKIATEDYLFLLKIIKEVQMLKQVSENTIRLGNESWQENYIKNLICVLQDSSLLELYKAYSCPVVIASGGPSLTKQLPLLKKIRKKIILIASGSTVNSLVKESIEPDYIVTIDGWDANYQHFKDLIIKEASLIYCLTSNYKIQYEYTGEKYAFLPIGESKFANILKERYKLELPQIAGGGSVANFAYTIAKYITSGPIALIGQDLAYTDNLTHADNNKRQKKITDDYFDNIEKLEIEGYYGDLVITDYALFSMKESFEKLHGIDKHSAPVFNCTEGGAKLEGFKQKSFASFAEEYVDEDDIKKIKSSINDSASLILLEENLNKEIEIYNQLEGLCRQAIELLDKNSKKNQFSNKTLKTLSKIDKKSGILLKEVFIEEIVRPVIMDVMRDFKEKENETSKERFERILTRNKLLYSKILEAVQKTKMFTMETKQIL